MEIDTNIPSPFLFNALKHHLGFIKGFIELAKSNSFSPEVINGHLVKVGKSMIDIYHGAFEQTEIIDEIQRYLISADNFEIATYHQFITTAPKKYRTINLSDGSSWTLLLGTTEQRYVHIHPSRGSLFTVRAKATALKAAIFILIYYSEVPFSSAVVKLANEVRMRFIGESPIKNETNTKGLQRVLNLF